MPDAFDWFGVFAYDTVRRPDSTPNSRRAYSNMFPPLDYLFDLPFAIQLLAVAAILLGVAKFAFWMDRVGQTTLDRIVAETLAAAESDPSPPVRLSFCAYRACLVFWQQSHYQMTLPHTTAVQLLGRLHFYTLCWAWLGPVAIILPWSFLTYFVERWRLFRQLRIALASPNDGDEIAPTSKQTW